MLFSSQAKGVGSAMRASLQRYRVRHASDGSAFRGAHSGFELKKNRNPIHHFEPRVKNPVSHSPMKLKKTRNLPISVESMEAETSFDIAGVRVICSYIPRCIRAAQSLKQDDLENRGESLYRAPETETGIEAQHVIVRIHLCISCMDKKELVP